MAIQAEPARKVSTTDQRDTHAQLVLVTGGLGYIGSHVVLALLLTQRYEPIIIDNCANGFPEALKRCGEIARQTLK